MKNKTNEKDVTFQCDSVDTRACVCVTEVILVHELSM